MEMVERIWNSVKLLGTSTNFRDRTAANMPIYHASVGQLSGPRNRQPRPSTTILTAQVLNDLAILHGDGDLGPYIECRTRKWSEVQWKPT